MMPSRIGLSSGTELKVIEKMERINNLMTWHPDFLDFKLITASALSTPDKQPQTTPIRIRKSEILYYYEW
jgi:hypothetical protein